MGPKHSHPKNTISATRNNDASQHPAWFNASKDSSTTTATSATTSPISLLSNLLSGDKKVNHCTQHNHRKKHILLKTIGLEMGIPMDVIALIGMSLISLTTGYWDPQHCSRNISITGDSKVTKLTSGGWANVLGLYPGSYKCRIYEIGGNYMMIGLASRNTKPDGENSETCGFYVYSSDASLWSERAEDRRRPYGEPKKAKKMESGSIVEVLLENGNTTIRYIINGTDCGIAFEKLDPREPLYPSIDLYNIDCAVTLI